MSFNISPSLFQICSNGTFIFNGKSHQLNLPQGSKLTSIQCQEMTKRIEHLLKESLKQSNDVVVKNGGKSKSLEERNIQFFDEQEMMKQIQIVVSQVLSVPKSLTILKEKEALLKPSKKEACPISFTWPPQKLKQSLVQSVQYFKQFVQALKEEVSAETQFFLGDFEKELEKIESFEGEELEQHLAMGKEFSEELDEHPDIPCFLKDEFKQWMMQMRHASSWKEVQETLKHSIETAQQAHIFDELIEKGASHQKHQFANILLHLYQADRPQYLGLRLKTADKLYARLVFHHLLNETEQQDLQLFLQALHIIVDPLISVPLEGRVKDPVSIPSYSKLEKLKEALCLIFEAIKQFFQRHAAWANAEETPDYLLVEHCDFDENLLAREEVFRYAAIPDLLASKEAQLEHLKAQNPLPKSWIYDLQEEIALYEANQKGRTWIPVYQLSKDYSHYQQVKRKVEEEEGLEKIYIPALINSYIHQIATEDDVLIMHRSGSLSYMLDDSTNLMDLKKNAMEEWSEKIKAASFPEFSLLAFEYLKKHWDIELYSTLKNIETRKRALEDQMVQLIAYQVRAHIMNIADSSKLTRLTRTIQMTQIGLLNPLKEFTEDSGLQISECHQMLDMAAMFQHFNGKEIRFDDVSAPFMDGNMIYLPLYFLEDPETGEPLVNLDIEEPFKLACAFFNISVEGMKVNKGEQKAINKYALQQMQANLENIQNFIEEYPEKSFSLKKPLISMMYRFKQIKLRLNQGETGYAIAQEIALLQHDMQGMIGINCGNGKDRTGYLVARLAAQHMDRQIDQRENLVQEEKDALKCKLRRDLMNRETGLASQVAYQNTGKRILKLHERKVMGINEGEGCFGDLARIGYSLLA